ncbi:aldehyde dehydrogenase family protein, partial [Burkholderia gladioli]
MNATPMPRAGQSLPTVKLLIDGEFVESGTREWREIVNPATQEVLARVPFATVAEVDAAVRAAHAAFAQWKSAPIGARMRIMLKYQDLIRANQQR